MRLVLVRSSVEAFDTLVFKLPLVPKVSFSVAFYNETYGLCGIHIKRPKLQNRCGVISESMVLVRIEVEVPYIGSDRYWFPFGGGLFAALSRSGFRWQLSGFNVAAYIPIELAHLFA